MQNAKFKINNFCLSLGADLFGVADIRDIRDEFSISPKVTESLDRAICLGVRLSRTILDEIEDHPTKLYYHHYRQVNMFLDQLALRLTNFIQKDGNVALPIPASQILDWQRQTAHLSHKEIGYHAGLGWMGRNNLLVNPRYGSQFRLVTVLTDLELEADGPKKGDCGECKWCIEVCPVGAIRENQRDFDLSACLEKLKSFQKKGIVNQYICGICVKACQGKEG